MDIRREAVGLKQELEHSLGVSPSIRWGGPGQLDVLVDGKLVFSKNRPAACRRRESWSA